MRIYRRKLSGIVAATLVAGLGMGAAELAAVPPPAHADPLFAKSYVAVGSDTLQDYFAALSGNPVGPSHTLFTPATAVNATTGGLFSITSWDATDRSIGGVNPGVISTKLSSPTFDRPNGSGAGRKALLDQIGAVGWDNSQVGGTAVNANTLLGTSLDIARSSSLSGTTGPSLAYVPLAIDGVTYAYFCGSATNGTNDCATLGNLSHTTLAALYGPTAGANGTLAAGATNGLPHDKLEACTMNVGSGTYAFFGKTLGIPSPASPLTQANTEDATVRNTGCGTTANPNVNIEENDLNAFFSSASALSAASVTAGNGPIDFVIPMSMGNVIGQQHAFSNDTFTTALGAGYAGGLSANNTGIGDIDGAAASEPFSVVAGSWQPVTAYYDGLFGRYLFAVLNAKKINGPTGTGAGADAGLVALFKNTTSAVCAPATGVATVSQFGFDTVTSGLTAPFTEPSVTGCGDTTSIIRGG
jgi:hypothetical protein